MRINTWFISSFLISIVVVIPILTVFSSFFEDTSNYFEYASVAERLYEPVKRENKIKVVTTTLNVKASGF